MKIPFRTVTNYHCMLCGIVCTYEQQAEHAFKCGLLAAWEKAIGDGRLAFDDAVRLLLDSGYDDAAKTYLLALLAPSFKFPLSTISHLVDLLIEEYHENHT